VALIFDKIDGYTLFTPIIIESENNSFSALALGPLAVLPQFQRRSIGSMIVNHGLYVSKKLKFGIIIVIGNPDYYKRFGFVSAHKNGIKTPFEVSNEVFMVIENNFGALKGVRGILRYPQDFLDLIKYLFKLPIQLPILELRVRLDLL